MLSAFVGRGLSRSRCAFLLGYLLGYSVGYERADIHAKIFTVLPVNVGRVVCGGSPPIKKGSGFLPLPLILSARSNDDPQPVHFLLFRVR